MSYYVDAAYVPGRLTAFLAACTAREVDIVARYKPEDPKAKVEIITAAQWGVIGWESSVDFYRESDLGNLWIFQISNGTPPNSKKEAFQGMYGLPSGLESECKFAIRANGSMIINDEDLIKVWKELK